jgi:cell fate regulator YaaT (PSP1 superfamily)
VRFKRCGKVYDFEACQETLKKGDTVVVESSFGLTLGSVVTETCDVESADKTLKKIIRAANESDLKIRDDNEAVEVEAKKYCAERISSRGLSMKLVYVESTLDKKRVVFYFTSDGRIDFRDLVKDLASKFRTRIEMRQIGVRDETKYIGGLGICGREVCCRTFLSNFTPISIKMAKKQDLSLNPGKLSGLCGRLMCCLGFEMGGGAHACAVLASDSEREELVLADDNAPDAVEAGEFELDMVESALASGVMTDKTPGGQTQAFVSGRPEKSQSEKSQSDRPQSEKSGKNRSRRDRARKDGRQNERPRGAAPGATPAAGAVDGEKKAPDGVLKAQPRRNDPRRPKPSQQPNAQSSQPNVQKGSPKSAQRPPKQTSSTTPAGARPPASVGVRPPASMATPSPASMGEQRLDTATSPQFDTVAAPQYDAGAAPPFDAVVGPPASGAPVDAAERTDNKTGQARNDRKRRWRNKRGKKNKTE